MLYDRNPAPPDAYNATEMPNEPRRVGSVEPAFNLLNDRIDALFRAIEDLDQRTRVVRAMRPREAQGVGVEKSNTSACPLTEAMEHAAARVNDSVQRISALIAEIEV